MKKSEAELLDGLAARGMPVRAQDLRVLLSAERSLHRWYELECGDGNDYASWSIERDEATEIPYRCVYPHNGEMYKTKIRDGEASAKRRIEATLKPYGLVALYQGDPRGCALYIATPADIAGLDPCNATTRGIAICV